jgi:hypothetical protein
MKPSNQVRMAAAAFAGTVAAAIGATAVTANSHKSADKPTLWNRTVVPVRQSQRTGQIPTNPAPTVSPQTVYLNAEGGASALARSLWASLRSVTALKLGDTKELTWLYQHDPSQGLTLIGQLPSTRPVATRFAIALELAAAQQKLQGPNGQQPATRRSAAQNLRQAALISSHNRNSPAQRSAHTQIAASVNAVEAGQPTERIAASIGLVFYELAAEATLEKTIDSLNPEPPSR